MYCGSGLGTEITRCTFQTNYCAPFGNGYGGGLYCAFGSDPIVTDCAFIDNRAAHGGGIATVIGAPVVTRCLFQENQANGESFGDGGALYRRSAGGPAYLIDCTLVGNRGVAYAGGIYCLEGSSVIVENTIIAFCTSGRAAFCAGGSTITLACSNVIGNLGGDWSGCIADQANINGNFSADPLFCDADNGDFTLSSQSPCLPGNHPDGADCGLIGAFGQGCGPVPVEQETWAGIKGKYRDER
jgi:hypothetical protein